MSDESIIDVSHLCRSFAGKTVVNDLSLQVKKGEVFGFLGPNGSGKTTTIRMLCGLLTPDSGEGHCLGFDIVRESKQIKQYVGYMTQKFSFYTDLSVEENLNFVTRVYGVKERKRRIEQTLTEFGLLQRRHQLTGKLSGGWQQRVALAACLIHEPQLLLLDEPTAGVDPIARRVFWDKIHSLSEQGITIFVSTHYMDEAERCTRLAYLSEGHLLITGTSDEVIQSVGLSTWNLSGNITTNTLKEAKEITGVTQAALFGNTIHICGLDVEKIESQLNRFASTHKLEWKKIRPSLEDTYISMVEQSGEDGS